MPGIVCSTWASSAAGTMAESRARSAPWRAAAGAANGAVCAAVGAPACAAGTAVAGGAAAAGLLPGSGMLATPCTARLSVLLPAGQGLFWTVSAPVASVQR
ncbi:hypothetical protein EA658_12190 [Pseudoxanthomonas winnipegensis]|uniref:Uncharacterized protein n=1 Tax=Pseudoxanthomonas winnipegensis TaxID=2480810 RepID=A0ABY1WDY8_9GAMM|nr:hypothetical protein EA659_01460 [Pseudoxanthomonas winnipegensis]TAA19592.1 hypothetical protein EA658_12190 [Pseudoxanthomonas winnipegensis]TAH70992.1 hypothetical protein EA657_15165 [Pseudoxanthomonas winnipegensis]